MGEKVSLDNEFISRYLSILRMARESGIKSITIPADHFKTGKASRTDFKRFVASCHRGFQKAQDAIIDEIEKIQLDASISDDEKEYREILLRKIIDHIAFTLLEGKVHIIRRTAYQSEIPAVNISTVRAAQKSANTANESSRATFSLLSDLSTFIHVCDILKIDHTQNKKISYIELKSGKMNSILSEKIKDFPLDRSSLLELDKDISLDKKARKQAQRMLKQKIRLSDLEDILETDSGIDLHAESPIKLSKDYISTDEFSGILNELIDNSRRKSISSISIDGCIHIGIGFDNDTIVSRRKAASVLNMQIQLERASASEDQQGFLDDASQKISFKGQFTAGDLFKTNLWSLPAQPFTTWGLSENNLRDMISGKIVVLFAFDLPMFLGLAKSHGVELEISSRSETTKIIEQHGHSNVPQWEHRGIAFKSINGVSTSGFLMSGFIARFIVNLTTPSSFLKGVNGSEIFDS